MSFKGITGGALARADATLAIETHTTDYNFLLVGSSHFLEEELRDVTNTGELAGQQMKGCRGQKFNG